MNHYGQTPEPEMGPEWQPHPDGGYINTLTGAYIPAGLQLNDPILQEPVAPMPPPPPQPLVLPPQLPPVGPAPPIYDTGGGVLPPPPPTYQPPVYQPPSGDGAPPVYQPPPPPPPPPPVTVQVPPQQPMTLPPPGEPPTPMQAPPGGVPGQEYAPALQTNGAAPRKPPLWIWGLVAVAGYFGWKYYKKANA